MTQHLSQKIRILSLLSIILVLYIHSGFHDYPNEIQGMTFNFKLQEAISGMLGRCAVPLFYAISGYLFFLGLDDGKEKADYGKLGIKIKKRLRTLFVPYIIACLFPAAFYFIMEQIPFCGKFLNGGGNFSENLKRPLHELIVFIYFDSGSGTPYAFHLWFLRDLIFIVILSPVLLYLRSLIGKYTVCGILFVMSFLMIPYFPILGMFWFMFGSCFLDKLSNLKSVFIPVSFLLLCIVQMSCPSGYWKYLNIPIIILGMVSIWIVYDKICPKTFDIRDHKVLMTVCSFTFFIYLFHEPTLNIVRKIIIIPFHHSSFGFAVSYLLSPWIFAFICIIVGMAFKKVLPRVYNICVGGR